MKYFLPLIILSFSQLIWSQEKISNVEFSSGNSKLLSATQNEYRQTGTLPTGETISTGCSHGACYFTIQHLGRNIEETIGDDITYLEIHSFDFGNDDIKEIVVINDFMETSFLFIYSYSNGLIKKLFEKEISLYRTVLKDNYIEYYMPSGLDQIWHYYQGEFWNLTPLNTR